MWRDAVATHSLIGDRHREVSWAERLGAIGWAAKGVVYLLLAVIVAQLAFSGSTGDESATKQGALERLSDQPFGAVMLAIVMVGLGAYAAYRLLSVFLPTTGNDGKDLAKHALRLGSAVVYGLLAWQAWSVLTGSRQGNAGAGDSSEAPRTWSALLLDSAVGQVLLTVVGIVLLGVAVDQVRRGVQHTFMKKIRCPGGWPNEDLVEKAGTVGYVGRGIVVALLGLFVVLAVVHHDPNEVQGLDGALRKVADATLGPLVLLAVAIGLAAYGLYSILAARCRRHSEG
jgi:hypothetical protein